MRTSSLLVFGCLLTTVLFWGSWASAEGSPQFEETIRQMMEKHHAAGLAVAVVKNGELAYTRSFGHKDLETSTPLSDGNIFRIASISKSFSATSVMQLVEKGKLNLSDSVGDLVGFPVRNPKFPETAITLAMLLSHTSSLNDKEGYFRLDVVNPAENKNAGNCYNDYRPGTKFLYCNLNFNLVGTIIERVSGERFDQYVKKHILDPLQLDGGYHVGALDASRFATLYSFDAKQIKLTPSPEAYAPRTEEIDHYQFGYSTPVFSPTGGMKISAKDLARYMTMHMNYGELGGVRIISEASSITMQEPFLPSGRYGLALMIKKDLIPGKTLIGHTGSAYGLYSMMFFEPKEKFGFVLITNGCDGAKSEGYVALLRDAARLAYEELVQEGREETGTFCSEDSEK